MPLDSPTVSIILPVRNEGSFIATCLAAVFAQDYPSDRTEILLVDGDSDDDTVSLARRYAYEARRDLRVFSNPRRIAPSALNLGIEGSSGDVIVRVDGHCVVATDFVRRGVEAVLASSDIGCAGGVLTTRGAGWVGRATAVAMSSRFGVGDSTFRVGSEVARDVDTVAFPTFRREVLEDAGPFDEELVRNQDDEYSYRLRRLGYRVVLDPRIRAEYFSRASLGSTFRQYLQYGYWKVRVLQKHPRQMRWRQFAPPALVAGLAAGAAMSPWSTGPLMALGILYFAANGLASIVEATRGGWRLLQALPLAFAALHLGYGLGFLVGLVRFAGRWGRKELPTSGSVEVLPK